MLHKALVGWRRQLLYYFDAGAHNRVQSRLAKQSRKKHVHVMVATPERAS